MNNSFLRYLSCMTLLAIIAMPAQGEASRYTQMPEELFLPAAKPHRATASRVVTVEPKMEVPKRIMSYGREVRLIGFPFLPDPEESIDFTAAAETTWWSTMIERTLAGWIAPTEVDEPPAVASGDDAPQWANLETSELRFE